MNEDMDDQKWVDALGGNLIDKQAPSVVEREASMIRNIMLRQIQERNSYEPSQARLDMLIAEAKKQGLLGMEARKWSLGSTINRIYEFLAMPSAVMASVALVLGLSITVGWQASEMNAPEDQVVRGGASGGRISQLVASPRETAQAWQKDLLEAGVEFAVSYEEPRSILIRMRLTPKAIEVLESRRIQAPPGKWVSLVIEVEKPSAQ